MRSRSLVRGFAVIASLVCAGACGNGTGGNFTGVNRTGGGLGGGATAVTYLGAMGDSLRHGSLSLTVTTSDVVNGTLTFVGGPVVSVAGTVDTTAATLTATGSGYTIAIAGLTNSGTISGSYTGPGGNGLLVAASDALTHMSHATYCGTYTSTNGNGWFDMQVLLSGGTSGFVVQTSGTAASSAFAGVVLSTTTLTATTSTGVGITGSLSSGVATVTGSYAPPKADTTTTGTTTGTPTGQFSATTGGC